MRAGQRSVESGYVMQGRPDTRRMTVQVLVEEPAGDHNLYGYDEGRRAVRLEGVVCGRGNSVWERGSVQQTRTASGKPLEALVLVRIATFPGCLVRGRVIGCAERATDQGPVPLLLAVPEADAGLASVMAIEDLPPGARGAAEGAIPCFRRWLPLDKAGEAVRQATEAYWRANGEPGDIRAAAAWKVKGPARGGQRREAEPHTWAEELVLSIPVRFQRYVEEMLLPDERILFFCERPEFTAAGRFALLGGQRARHGLLLVTDRQVLAMWDSLPPDSTLVDWGYVAKATAVERVRSAQTARDGLAAEFRLVIRAEGGAEHFAFPFPADHGETLEEAVRLLRGFSEPAPGALARVYEGRPAGLAKPELGPLAGEHGHLEQVIAAAGGADVLAAAVARPPEGRGLGPMIAVTAERVAAFPGGRLQEGRIRTLPISSISSVELTQSLIMCRLDIISPGQEGPGRLSIRYDYPASPAFTQAFIVLRHLLGRAPIP